MLTTASLRRREARRAVRQARAVYVRTEVGLFKVTKCEALKVLCPDHPAPAVRVQKFQDAVCIG